MSKVTFNFDLGSKELEKQVGNKYLLVMAKQAGAPALPMWSHVAQASADQQGFSGAAAGEKAPFDFSYSLAPFRSTPESTRSDVVHLEVSSPVAPLLAGAPGELKLGVAGEEGGKD